MNVLKLVFRFLIVIVIVLFVIGELVLPNEKMDESYGELFEVPWLMTREDGSKSELHIPGNYDLPRNEKVFVETVLPENIEENFYLCFFSNRQDMEIYVDEELRQEYSTKDSRPYGRSSSAAFSGVGVLLLALTMIADCVRGYIGQYKLVAIGIVGASFAAVIQLVLYFRRTIASSGFLIACGMLFLLVSSSVNTIRDLIRSEKEKQHAIYLESR